MVEKSTPIWQIFYRVEKQYDKTIFTVIVIVTIDLSGKRGNELFAWLR
jgi:hypothetical protein